MSTEPTNAELADFLHAAADNAFGAEDQSYLRLAAARLTQPVAEEEVERAALAIMNVWRARYGFAPMAWDDPNFREDEKLRAIEEARAALNAAAQGRGE